MDLGLKNRVALVAASSRGLGKAVAWGLAKEGTKLVICSRNKDILEKTADDILLKTGVTVFPLAMDLTNHEQINWLIEETMDLFGKVDILITNSGGPPPGNFNDVLETDWKNSYQLNLMSAILLTKAVIPGMQKQKWGRIVYMTSVTVKQYMPGMVLSNVIRPSILALMKNMSHELAKDNILVNSVCPGYFITDRVKQLIEDKAKKEKKKASKITEDFIAEIPLARMGNPEEFANLVVFLASERASYITGSAISIDGGLLRGLL